MHTMFDGYSHLKTGVTGACQRVMHFGNATKVHGSEVYLLDKAPQNLFSSLEHSAAPVSKLGLALLALSCRLAELSQGCNVCC